MHEYGGTFITFEGIDGSGKSTQIKLLANLLKQANYDVEISFEPGGTDIGYLIRQILKNSSHSNIDVLADMFLFMADRSQHLVEKIIPALKSNKVFISDRYYDSTRAFQAARGGVTDDIIMDAHSQFLPNVHPDITFLLDISVEDGFSRTKLALQSGVRNKTNTRFEDYDVEFHNRVRHNYLMFANKEPDRFVIIDGNQSICQISNQIFKIALFKLYN